MIVETNSNNESGSHSDRGTDSEKGSSWQWLNKSYLVISTCLHFFSRKQYLHFLWAGESSTHSSPSSPPFLDLINISTGQLLIITSMKTTRWRWLGQQWNNRAAFIDKVMTNERTVEHDITFDWLRCRICADLTVWNIVPGLWKKTNQTQIC